MKDRKNRSSIFASKVAAPISLLLLFLSIYLGLYQLSVFFFLLMCLAGLTAVWGQKSVKGLILDVEAADYGEYPGAEIPICLHLQNNKLLPLFWCRLLLPETEDSPLLPLHG